MTAVKLRLALAAIGQKETIVSQLCKELGITRHTLYRYVSPTSELRPDGEKLLSAGQAALLNNSLVVVNHTRGI